MSDSMLTAEGYNGDLELTETVVRIRRKGLLSVLAQGFKGDKEILISQVTSVQFKPANFWLNGYIQFAFVGGLENLGGLMSAAEDENTVLFKEGQQPAFERFRDEVMKRIAQARAPTGPAPSAADEIERLAGLRDRRLISDDEFQAAKRKLLGI